MVNKTKYEDKARKIEAVNEVADNILYYIKSSEEDVESYRTSLANVEEGESHDWERKRYSDNVKKKEAVLEIWEKLYDYLDKLC